LSKNNINFTKKMMNKSLSTFSIAAFAIILFSAFSFQNIDIDPKSKSLIDNLYEVNGGWDMLVSKKDVQYTYIYKDFKKGTDMSTERYIFDGEASWGEYSQHEANVLPGMEGVAKQCYMDGEAKISCAGKMITDPKAVGGTEFLRVANYFWFAMMYKLDDPGTHHKYMGQEEVNEVMYDKVSLSYNPQEVGKEVNDAYVLYFNPKTHLVDQFMFSLPALGVDKPILRMDLDYEKIDGVYIATTRRAYAPNKEGVYGQMGEYITKDIKFSNGFKKEDFKI